MINFSIDDKNKYLLNNKIEIVSIINKSCIFICKELNINEPKYFDINFVGSRKIRSINKKYRLKDTKTDVISFAFCDNKEVDTPLLGEVFVCFPQAVIQSKKYEHSLIREIVFLIIHGLLHLLGYDHQDTKSEQKMLKLTYQVLDTLKENIN